MSASTQSSGESNTQANTSQESESQHPHPPATASPGTTSPPEAIALPVAVSVSVASQAHKTLGDRIKTHWARYRHKEDKQNTTTTTAPTTTTTTTTTAAASPQPASQEQQSEEPQHDNNNTTQHISITAATPTQVAAAIPTNTTTTVVTAASSLPNSTSTHVASSSPSSSLALPAALSHKTERIKDKAYVLIKPATSSAHTHNSSTQTTQQGGPTASSSTPPVSPFPASSVISPSGSSVHPVLGTLQLRVVSGRNLGPASSRTMRTHLEIYFETQHFRSPSVIGTQPFYAYNITCEVTDITNDIVIQVIEEHKLTKNTPLGQIITSLATLVEQDLHPLATHFPLDEWVELYPANYDEGPNALFYHKWPSNEHRITGAGMRKPQRWPIGQLHVKYELQLYHSVAYCYAMSSPIRHKKPRVKTKRNKKDKELLHHSSSAQLNGISSTTTTTPSSSYSTALVTTNSAQIASTTSIVSGSAAINSPSTTVIASPSSTASTGDTSPVSPSAAVTLNQRKEIWDFHPPTFKKNFRRLQRWHNQPAHWLYYAKRCIQWESPLLSLLSLFILYALCFNTYAHHIPLLLFAGLFLIGLASYARQDHSDVITFDTEAIPSEWLKEGAIHKAKRWRGMAGKASYMLGTVASRLEQASALLNWTDPHLSLLVYTLLLTGCSGLTLLFYFVRPGIVFFVVGVCVMLNGLIGALNRWEVDYHTLQKMTAMLEEMEKLASFRKPLGLPTSTATQHTHTVGTQTGHSNGDEHPKKDGADAATANPLSSPTSSLPGVASPALVSTASHGSTSRRTFFSTLRRRTANKINELRLERKKLTLSLEHDQQPQQGLVEHSGHSVSPSPVSTNSPARSPSLSVDSGSNATQGTQTVSGRPRASSVEALSPSANNSTTVLPASASVASAPASPRSSPGVSPPERTKKLTSSVSVPALDIHRTNSSNIPILDGSKPIITRPSYRDRLYNAYTAVSTALRTVLLYARAVVEYVLYYASLLHLIVVHVTERAPDSLEVAHRVIGQRAMRDPAVVSVGVNTEKINKRKKAAGVTEIQDTTAQLQRAATVSATTTAGATASQVVPLAAATAVSLSRPHSPQDKLSPTSPPRSANHTTMKVEWESDEDGASSSSDDETGEFD